MLEDPNLSAKSLAADWNIPVFLLVNGLIQSNDLCKWTVSFHQKVHYVYLNSHIEDNKTFFAGILKVIAQQNVKQWGQNETLVGFSRCG